MNIRDVKPEDWNEDFKGDLEFLKNKYPETYTDLVDYLQRGNSSLTAFEQDGELMGIMQYVEYAPRCLYIAVYPTKKIVKHKMAAARLMKKYMQHVAKCCNIVRMETRSIDNEFLNRWHEFLGFKLEGKCPKYAFGVNYNLWGVLFDGN